MNRDELKGKGKGIMGRAQRQVGEWTGDRDSQAKGAGKQVEGKGQNVLGKIKNAGNDLKRDLQGNREERAEDRDMEHRDRNAA